MIQSKEDAARAIKEVCEWIKTQPTHPLDDYGGAPFEKKPQISLGYGRMNERMGFACANPELSDPNQRSVVVFFVNGHGLCEGWTRQENQHVS